MINESILRPEERAVYELRALYSELGYAPFKMSKFEEYELYSKNKEFLVSDSIITFNDEGGRLLALKPDVTLSIIKNYDNASGGACKYYYNENVYRPDANGAFSEIMQTGVECMGDIGSGETEEVLLLALESMARVSDQFVLEISHVGFLKALLSSFGVNDIDGAIAAIAAKNSAELMALTDDKQFKSLGILIECCGTELSQRLREISLSSADLLAKYDELYAPYEKLCASGYADRLIIDFSLTGAAGYYSGIVFKGYVYGVSDAILCGGAYDGLMKRLGKRGRAIGFAVYLDRIFSHRASRDGDDGYVNIALPKGRLGERVYAMLEAAGFECPAIKEPNRKLVFENPDKRIRYFWVKPSDVAIYVERAAADIGIVGKDILLEYSPDVYELLDLGVGRCRMAVAAKCDFTDDKAATLRVATKFAGIAKKYYASKCRDIDIINLQGSIEIAPILGLSDVIVDIVETGKTLRENGLTEYEQVCEISARMVSNKASYGFKRDMIENIKAGLAKLL